MDEVARAIYDDLQLWAMGVSEPDRVRLISENIKNLRERHCRMVFRKNRGNRKNRGKQQYGPDGFIWAD